MEIRPFRGWRFGGGEVSDFIAPPYDVLSPADKAALLARCDKNIVAADLPVVPASAAGADEVYRRSAETLAAWKASGVLIQDNMHSLYAYEQAFTWAGRRYVRRAMLCGVRATELGRDIIPHEHTFDGPKADRLKLTEFTRMQLSPIFGFYKDIDNHAADLLWAAAEGAPAAAGSLRGVEEKLWVVSDPPLVGAIAEALRDVPVFIADGHHRYTTALGYCRALRDAGKIGPDHEANFVLFALVPRDDPGMRMLPTHRILSGLKAGLDLKTLPQIAPEFRWERCSVEDADLADADAFLRRHGRGAIGVIGAHPSEIWIAVLKDPQAMKLAAPDQGDEWRKLDVAVLHKLLIDKALAPWRTGQTSIEYTPDGRTVLAACQSGRAQLAFCVQSTPIEAVEAIARAGASMPHKSTYFYPKLATGMVLKGLE